MPEASDRIVVIDGGFSTQLAFHVKTANIDGDPLWSARFVRNY